MSAEVNKVITGTYDHVGDAVIYGDTDSFTLVHIQCSNKTLEKERSWSLKKMLLHFMIK